MTKMTRAGLVYGVMNGNATLPMDEVLALIVEADANSGLSGKACDLKRAKAYYTHAVKNGLADGVGATKTTRTPKAKTVKAPKVQKAKPDLSITKDRKPIKDKTVEEIADIRAKNIARMKAVSRKYAKGQFAEPRYSDEPFDENAVPNLENELESFKAPKFLSMDQVKALV